MPRFPSYERQVGLQGGSTASYASDGAFTAPARALAGAGDAISNIGEDFARIAAKSRDDKRNSQLSLDTSDMQLQLEEQDRQARQSATGEAAGFADSARERFDSFVKTKLEANPDPEYQRRFQDWANDYKVRYVTKAATFQAESEIGKRTTDLGTALENFGKLVYADPSQYESALQQGNAALTAAKSWMTPEQEALAREKFTHDLNYARAKSVMDTSPEDFIAEMGTSPVGGDAAAVIREFEGYRDTPYWDVNAHRVGYGSDTVTKSDGSVVKVTKDMRISRADAERDLARRTKEFAGVASRQVGAREWGALPGNVQAALTSVAYNYGELPTSVVNTVKTGNIEAIAQSVEGLSGHNDGINASRRSKEAAIIRGGAIPASKTFVDDPRFAGLSVDEIRSLSSQAEQAVNTNATNAYNAAKDSIELGIATGQVISEAQILDSNLRDGDKATLLGKFRARNEDESLITTTLAGLADGSLNVSPYDAKATKALDTISERAEKGGTAEQFVQSSEEIVRQTGIVPKPYMNRIRQGLESTNVQEVGTAAELARRLYQTDPAALGRRDGGDAVEKDAIAYSHYVDNVGMSPEQAAKRLIDMKDPEKVRARASLMEAKPTKDWITKQATENNVRDIFDPGVFGFDPNLGTNPAQSAAMVGEYKSILEESLWDANGDQDLAKTYAKERFGKRYGTSTFTLDGDDVVSRLPPEKTYPVGADGTHEYLRDQVLFALEQEGIKTDKVYLQSDDITNNDFVRGQPARYLVYYEKDGEIEQFNLPFYGVPEAEAGIPNSRIEESRARRNQYIQQSPMEQMLREDAIRGAEVPSPLTGQ